MTSENTTDSATNPPAVTEISQDINPSSETGLAATRGNRNGALDGLRGLAVIAVMAYHVVPNPFTGGWLGVDLFFVLSGFLICAMLLREHDRTDAIDYKRFLIRRARRLLPGLILMLIAVLTAASIFEYAGRRKHVAIDVLSSFFQVSNWRLILANESYFANVSVPSPIRHTWSLGVQEQFYFIFPLVLLFLFKKARTWNTILLVLAVIGGVSFWRMLDLYVPGTDPSRVYFGTDTRLYELLIGVIGAIWLHRRTQRAASGRARGPRGWGRQANNSSAFLAWSL
ncbi:MAG: acyltransferase [Aeromicrobium sp.]|nr:MAG: acyltransferase [Aeromicrobium sp.]